MGTYRRSDDMLITIPLAQERAAYEALIEYRQNTNYQDVTLKSYLETEGFFVNRYDEQHGNCVELIQMFEAKHYNLQTLFTTLAPFVRDGSYCTVIVEDGKQYQYQFSDGKVVEKQAKIIFE